MFYFSTERPITPGSLPNHLKPLSVENFPEKTYCPEIEGEAWGKVEFENPLSGYEAMLSELVPRALCASWQAVRFPLSSGCWPGWTS